MWVGEWQVDAEYTIADLMEVFSVGRATVYRTHERTASVR